MKEKALWLAIGVVVGIVFSQQISQLPLVNKLPKV
jgi:hypothetical protein